MAGRLGALLALTAVIGCAERDRLTFGLPPAGDGVGPLSIIDRPAQDTVVLPGRDVPLSGRVTDIDGVDSVYFEVTGGSVSFSPLDSNGDTIRWGLMLPTTGLTGQTITLRVFGVDEGGARGQAAVRNVTVQ